MKQECLSGDVTIRVARDGGAGKIMGVVSLWHAKVVEED